MERDREERFSFPFLVKSTFPQLNSGVLVFLCSVYKIIFPSLNIVWSLESRLFLLQKCSNGQIFTAMRKGKIETVFSIIASILPLVLAEETWPVTSREMLD